MWIEPLEGWAQIGKDSETGSGFSIRSGTGHHVSCPGSSRHAYD